MRGKKGFRGSAMRNPDFPDGMRLPNHFAGTATNALTRVCNVDETVHQILGNS